MRLLSYALVLAACGNHGNGNTPDAPGTGADAPPDMSTGFVEAMHPSQPVISNAGGNVLTAPTVVPIFFANDATTQAQVETYLSTLAGSSYWTAIAHEYGVGTLTIAPSVVATETPPTDDSGVQSLVTAHAGGTGGWPANTPNTIYAVFLPDGVSLTMGGGTSCTDFGGYHNETSGNVVYALLPRCANSMTFQEFDYLTIATSHELLEASTDPHPQSNPAFVVPDDADAILGLMPGGELGDMCEAARGSYQRILGQYMVQRTWSNESAAAGHDPCVPEMPTGYVEAAANQQLISINAGGQTLMTRGVQVALGQQADVEVDLYSDAPAQDFTVIAYDVASHYQMQPQELDLTFDRTTGNNGDKLKLTIKRLAAASQFGVSEFVLFTQVNGVSTGFWFGLVSQ